MQATLGNLVSRRLIQAPSAPGRPGRPRSVGSRSLCTAVGATRERRRQLDGHPAMATALAPARGLGGRGAPRRQERRAARHQQPRGPARHRDQPAAAPATTARPKARASRCTSPRAAGCAARPPCRSKPPLQTEADKAVLDREADRGRRERRGSRLCWPTECRSAISLRKPASRGRPCTGSRRSSSGTPKPSRMGRRKPSENNGLSAVSRCPTP